MNTILNYGNSLPHFVITSAGIAPAGGTITSSEVTIQMKNPLPAVPRATTPAPAATAAWHSRPRLKKGLPKGLWVGRQLKKGAVKPLKSEIPKGKRPWQIFPDRYSDEYFYKLARTGRKPIKLSTDAESYPEAVERAMVAYKVWNSENWEANRTRFSPRPKKVALLGELIEAFKKVFKHKHQQRPVNSARLVYAIAKGWLIPDPDPRSRKNAIRDGSDLQKKIDKERMDDVFTAATVKAYFAVKQGGTYDGLVESLDHISINGLLENARRLFSADALQFAYEGLALSDVSEFKSFLLLREKEAPKRWKAVPHDKWAAMLRAALELEKSADLKDRELALANWMLRTLALRTSELLHARRDWIIEQDGRLFLDVREYEEQPYIGRPGLHYKPKSKEAGQIPLNDDLAKVLLARPDGYLILPDGAPSTRADLVKRLHNAFVKLHIGEVERADGTVRNNQGNHRLRNHVASYLAFDYNDTISATYLRHSDHGDSEDDESTKNENKIVRESYIYRDYLSLAPVYDAQILDWAKRSTVAAVPNHLRRVAAAPAAE